MITNCVVGHGEAAASHFNSTCLRSTTIYDCIAADDGYGIFGKCIPDINLAATTIRFTVVAA